MPTRVDIVCPCCGKKYTWLVPDLCPVCAQQAEASADQDDPEIALALARMEEGK